MPDAVEVIFLVAAKDFNFELLENIEGELTARMAPARSKVGAVVL